MIFRKAIRSTLLPPRPRRWWQVLLRVGVTLAVILAGLYVALPFFLPVETIRKQLADSLTEQLGVEVIVGPMQIGWGEGVVIDGLRMANPPGFSDGPMLQIQRIRCDFSPLRFLLQRRLAWMDVDQLLLHAESDAAGRLNTSCLTRLKMDVDTQRLRVRRSRVSVELREQPRPLVLRISDLQILRRHTADLGQVTMTGSFAQDGAPAPMSLRISAGDAEGQAAMVDCRFSDLDLAQLPRSKAVWGDLPIESLRGTCGGQLVFTVGKDLTVEDFRLELLARELEVKPIGAATLPKIDQAGLRLAAGIDALSERADVRQFQLRIPGLRLSGKGVVYADLLRGDWEALERFQLHGETYPDRLSTLLTGQATLPNGVEVTGPVNVDVAAQNQDGALVVDLRVNGDSTSIRTPRKLLKPREQRLGFQLRAALRHVSNAWPVKLELAQLVLGDNVITATGRLGDLQRLRTPEISDAPEAVLAAALGALREVSLQGTADIKDPSALLRLVSEEALDSLEIKGTWSGPWILRPGAKPRFSLGLRSNPNAQLRLPGVFAKPKGQELALEFSAEIDPDKQRVTHILLDALAEPGRISLDEIFVTLPTKKTPLMFRGNFEIDRLGAFLAWLPRESRGTIDVIGGLAGTFSGELARTTGESTIQIETDLDDTALAVGEAFSKPAGEKTRLNIKAFRETSRTGGNAWGVFAEAQFKQAKLDCTVRGDEKDLRFRGSAKIEDAAWLQSLSPALHRALDGGRLAGPLFVSGAARLRSETLTYSLRTGSKKLDCVIGSERPTVNLKLEGHIRSQGTVHMDRKNLVLKLNVDATDVGLEDVEGFTKPRREPAAVSVDVALSRDLSAMQVRQLIVKMGDSILAVGMRGKMKRNDAGLPIGIEPIEGNISVATKDASVLARFWPALKKHNLTGSVHAQLDWSAGPDTWGTVSRLWFGAKDARGIYRGKNCFLDGVVTADKINLTDGSTVQIGRIRTDNLEFAVGDNHGWLLAEIQSRPDKPTGEFHVLFESLDDKDLADWLASPTPASAPASASTSRPEADRALQRRAERLIAQGRDLFKQADLTGRVSATRYRTYDPNVQQVYPTDEVELRLRIRENDVTIDYNAGLYGGRVSGRIHTGLDAPQPVVTSKTEYVDVKATPTIQPQISRMFPGNTVNGQFNRTEDVHYSLRDFLCHTLDSEYRLIPEGVATMVATDGVVVGKAAPDFVVKMFPGLNLTKYPYRTMTAFTKFLPTGASENETFFYGRHDLYMDGVTQADNTIQYTIGLVLLGRAFPAEALRDWRQGRIPILKVKGRIEDGTLVDDEVSYPLPNETLFELFVKNNLVYRAWVNLNNKPAAFPAFPSERPKDQ